MFCNFCEIFENSKWPPFFARQNFLENWHGYSAEIPCRSKILSKSLHVAGFSRYKHFYLLQFLRKIQNGRHFWRENFFLKIGITTLQRSGESKISSKSLHVAGFSRYKHFYLLQFLRKIQNGRHFWRENFFLKIGITTLQRYPGGQKFRQSRSM